VDGEAARQGSKKEARGHLSGDHVHVDVCVGGGDGGDVLSLAGAVGLRMNKVEVARLVVAVFASVGWPGQDGVFQGGQPRRNAPRCRSSFGSSPGLRRRLPCATVGI
jgi:hypothetical protein